ncbi:amino acid adenylation domain-containing protein [Pseudoalteromonas rhizosphaerae]|uniref:Amino acid adenylation domain-containing protein n=1 Tax=Pseudoalteromonas rhizosphaerae TaxID=2518973 RepID=A0ABW8L4S9_9GAMM
MEVMNILTEAQGKGIYLFLEQGKLKFKAKTTHFPDALKSKIKANKAELIELLEQMDTGIDCIHSEIKLLDRGSISKFPLSSPQKRLWTLAQLSDLGASYNMSFALSWTHELKLMQFNTSILALINRHEAIRTTFTVDESGEPCQVINEHDKYECVFIDLCGQEPMAQQQRIEALLQQEMCFEFDLEHDLMLRVVVVRKHQNDHVIVLTMHHIASDGWSMDIMRQELLALYMAEVADNPLVLEELPHQYVDYASWEAHYLQSKAIKKQIAYWREQLKNIPSVHGLVLDYPRPAEKQYVGADVKHSLAAGIARKLTVLAGQLEITPFVLLHAALSLVLARHSNTNDIVIGTPVSGRIQPSLQPLIGFFVNNLVLRVSTDHESLYEYLQHVKAVHEEAHKNQGVPFEQLVEELEMPRTAAHMPLFQIMLHGQSNLSTKKEVDAATPVTLLPNNEVYCKYDMEINLHLDEHSVLLNFTYDTSLFERASIERYCSHVTNIFTELAHSKDLQQAKVAELHMLSSQEQAYLIRQFNDSARDIPDHVCINNLFSQQVMQFPDNPAVSFAGQSITYRELYEQANKLANYLIAQHGVTPQNRVGLYIDRSIDMVVSLVAIIQAGGIYIPLDPNNPAERIAYMMSDSKLDLVVTCQACLKQLSLSEYEQVFVVLDDNGTRQEIERSAASSPNIQISADSLAYINYTSGSTGNPKGVMVEHTALVNAIVDNYIQFGVTSRSHFYHSTAFGFDVASGVVWMCLCTGAHMTVSSSLDMQHELEQLDSITHLMMTPSILAEIDPTPLDTIEVVISGGEACESRTRARWQHIARFFNAYGPTEATIWCAIECVSMGQRSIPIGKPMSNTSLFVLNAQQQLTPKGVIGELYIGGRGLARGYFNRPDMTSEKFIPNPFYDPETPSSSARLYRTGDLVRMTKQGDIEFVGRTDSQIKLMGYRIELREIEFHLQNLPEVEVAAVVVKGSGQSKRLVGFIELIDHFKTQKSEVLQAITTKLAEKIPSYMVPNTLEVVTEWPLTVNGKIDRKCLATTVATTLETNFVAPTTEIEKRLAALCSKLLPVDEEEIGITTNFFSMGGNSLLAIRLNAILKKQLGFSINLAHFFEAPTIQNLARQFATQQRVNGHQLVPIERNASEYPLSHAQKRLWFLDTLQGGSAEYNIFSAFKLSGEFDVLIAETAFLEIIERHEILRTVYKGEEDVKQSILAFSDINFSIKLTYLTKAAPEQQAVEVAQLLQHEARYVFDLAKDLMIRVQFIQLAPQQSLLIVNIHHIAADGWSIEIVKNEFLQRYRELTTGKACTLPKLDIQYVDYAKWQSEYLNHSEAKKQLNYWYHQLADAPSSHGLTLDYARPTQQHYDGAKVKQKLPAGVAAGLGSVAEQFNMTPFMLLHAALSLVLSRHSNCTDILIGTPVANRQDPILASLIGCFVNTVVLRVDTEFELLIDYLQHVKKVHLEALSNQDIPFEKLVDELNIERSTSLTPIFQVLMLTHTEFGIHQKDWDTDSGLNIESYQIDGGFCKFDIEAGLYLSNDSVHIEFSYATSLFKRERIERIVQHLANILTTLSQCQPSLVVLKEVPMLSQTEATKQVTQLSEPSVEQDDALVHQAFSKVAMQFGDAVAVRQGKHAISYAMLERKSNQLAHLLLDQYELKPGCLVGLCLHRSIDVIVAILAVLKVGGAYVPLDMNAPRQRLAHQVQDTAITALICHRDVAQLFDGIYGALLSFEKDELSREPSLQLASYSDVAIVDDNSSAAEDSLAYVIFTSGSSGMAKGVCQTHRTILNLVYGTTDKQSRQNTLQFAPYTFDVAVQEIFVALLTGSELHFIPQVLKDDLLALANNTIWHCIERAFLPPKVFDMLAQEWITSEVIQSVKLKHVYLAGEACDLTPAIRAWIEADHLHKLFNHYGPTETHVVTSFEINRDNIHSLGQYAPLGRMTAGHSALVLQADRTFTPQGEVGELWIYGAGLATGYLNQPELTHLKFRELAICDGKTQRYYQTGDLVRWEANNTLYFVGRKDRQVQLRGFRIELSEIENCINKLTDVESCLVLKCQINSADHLVAYIKKQSGFVLTDRELTSRLQQALAEQVPSYMVPKCFILVNEWPLTANGKVDTARLDAPDIAILEGQYHAPSNEIEQELVNIWAKLLNIPTKEISTYSKFFELGGDSLSVVKLASSIRKQFDKSISLADIFNRPTITAIAENLGNQTSHPSVPSIVRYDSTSDMAPASYSQQRMWFIDKLQGQSIEYNLPLLFKVSGRLNIDVIRATGAQILHRQQVLQSRFIERDGVIYQTTGGESTLPVIEYDLQHLDAGGQELQVAELISEGVTYRFNLESDLPIRVTAITLSVDSAMLLFNVHHIVADGWSLEVLANEFCSLYRANVTGETLHLPKLPVQYHDYAHWQRTYMQSDAASKQLAYWQTQLHELPAVHSLPLKEARPAIKQNVAGVVTGHIDEITGERLHTIAKEHDLTTFMLLHSVLAILISRHSGSNDVVIGIPVANRTQVELESLVGLFVNTLVLRLNTEPQSITEYFSRVREVHSKAHANQDVPFDFLVEHLQSARHTSHSPLFQILMTSSNDYGVMDAGQQGEIKLPNATLTPSELGAAFSKFDLEIDFDLTNQGMGVTWSFDNALFSSEYIELLNIHFCRLIDSVCSISEPHSSPLTVLTMLSTLEHEALLYDINDTARDYATDICIHQLFEQCAVEQPDHIAVVFEERSLTYSELNAKANQLARYIHTQAVIMPDTVVGLYAERSIEMVVAILAILKAGAAYLPLEPSLPSGRLEHALDDAGVELVLSHAKNPLPLAYKGLEIILAQSLWSITGVIAQYSHQNLPLNTLGLNANNLAYVIYTSGSTGLPKGVMVEHRALFNRIHWMNNQYGMGLHDKVLQKTPFGFDVSVWEFLWTLGYGGQLVMARPEGHKEPKYMSQLIQQAGITKLHFVPSMLGVILEHDALSQCHSIRQIFCSGEALQLNHVSEVYAQLPQVELHNLYGPTEAAIDVSFWDCRGDNRSSVPIGRPIDNTQLLILNDSQQLAPHGTVGELYIGGDCLARGYLNREQLTAERFIINPYYEAGHQNSSRRLYRTGDLAWLRRDGIIEYLGRADHQVKISGLRVELGEIEYQLSCLAGVESAVVAATEKGSTVQLTAYIRLNAGVELDRWNIKDVRSALVLLPIHMLPSQLVVLTEWPQTINGKIDKKALPEPQQCMEPATLTMPVTESECLLSDIWASLLGLKKERLCIHANFFELGGHSILGIRILNEVNERFSVSLSIQELFKYQTISELAALIEGVVMLSKRADKQVTTMEDYEDFSL